MLNESWKADTLVVDDGSLRRTTYITPDAKVLRTVVYPDQGMKQLDPGRLGVSGTFALSRVLAWNLDGSLLSYWNEPVTNPTPLRRAFGGVSYIIRLSPDGKARAVVRNPDHADERWALESDGMGTTMPFTFYPVTVASSNGDRLAHMTSVPTSRDGGTFTVSAFRSNGDTMFVRTFPFRGEPVSMASRDSALKEFTPSGEGSTSTSLHFREVARQKMPTIHPGVTDIQLGLDNTVWITQRRTSAGQPVLVLNRNGDAVATVMIPRNSRLRQASATHIWATEKDDDGLTSVVRYKVSGINCGTVPC